MENDNSTFFPRKHSSLETSLNYVLKSHVSNCLFTRQGRREIKTVSASKILPEKKIIDKPRTKYDEIFC